MKKIIIVLLALAIGFCVGVAATIYTAQPEDDVTTLYFDGLFCVEYEGV